MSKTNFKRIAAAALAVLMLLSVVACGKTPAAAGTYTYRTYTGVSPSNWNELTYQDSNDTQIMSYIGSSFFSYDFKFDADGNIVPGDFVVKYEAATKLEDVSASVDAKWGIPADAKGRAYKITLRNDLKWDDGTPIKAEDFVYTMSEQLNPLFFNYRADSFYTGATIIINAQNYLKQGQHYDLLDNGGAEIYTLANLVKGDDGVYTQPNGKAIYFDLDYQYAQTGNYNVSIYANAGYLNGTAFAALKKLADADGKVAITDESVALWETLINTAAWGNEDPSYVPKYWVIEDYDYPEMDFSEVGLYAASDYELVIVLAKSLPLLKEDGSLSYQAAYNMASLPLVKKSLYEANKVAPAEGSTLWTTTYNTSLESTASWGPYKLESFQPGKQYTLVRNDNWYGYDLAENKGLYQTDKIVCDTVKEWDSAWSMFQAGQIDGIGIDVKIADEYKGSEQAYFTPDDYVASMQLQSDKEALEERQTEGVNKTILSYADFRKAISLSMDRASFTKTCTTSSLPGFGLFNSMHYYDVENGGVFRDTDEAKKVLCEVYAVDWTQYESLDDAVEAITGYNPGEAKKLLTKAYSDALAAGDIKETDKVVLTFGTSVINEATTRQVNFLNNALQELAKDTPLEGRIEVEEKEFGTTWANSFRAGAYDVCLGGWSGAAWDPGYFLLAYLSPDYMYSTAWDTSSVMMKFTMKGVAADGGDITDEMSLMAWYECLNGSSGAKYDFSATALPQSKRLQLIAALEKEVLSVYYTVPLYNYFSASLRSFKIEHFSDEYNTFMGYGGIKYMKYNYTDAEWAEKVAEVGGVLDYK